MTHDSSPMSLTLKNCNHVVGIDNLQHQNSEDKIDMNKVRKTQKGNRCIAANLSNKPKTITRVEFWDIRSEKSSQVNICMKLGKYRKTRGYTAYTVKTLECQNPKSQVSLDREEFQSLLEFLQANYEPFSQGYDSFIPLGGKFDQETIDAFLAIIDSPAKTEFLDSIANNEILADELMSALKRKTRVKAVKEFEAMLSKDLLEQEWQTWFEHNAWVFGIDSVRILRERAIDTANITDYLVQAYDGFLDIVEIKRPDGGTQFWANNQDRRNYVQSHQLTKAITQAITYLSELEREANSVKFLERVGIKAIKPRCALIFGRSEGWNDHQKEAYRILNSSHKDLTILTYDHLLDRAKRIVGMNELDHYNNNETTESDCDDIPF